jgi:histidinol-phosphatase
VSTPFAAELSFAHEAADLAASITRTAFGGRQPVTIKRDRTPVTEVDDRTERALREVAHEAFPSDAFLGEERGRSGPAGARTWIVDPIDGTKHYADGVPLWTTLIALEDEEGIAVAVADVPMLGTRYHAVRGGGSWRGDRRIEVARTALLEDASVMHSGLDEWIPGGRIGGLLRVGAEARRTRGLSDSWGQLLVAEGAADVLLEHEPCAPWDYTACALIVEEAGGRVTTLDGLALSPGCSLLASNGTLHDDVLELLEASPPR